MALVHGCRQQFMRMADSRSSLNVLFFFVFFVYFPFSALFFFLTFFCLSVFFFFFLTNSSYSHFVFYYGALSALGLWCSQKTFDLQIFNLVFTLLHAFLDDYKFFKRQYIPTGFCRDASVCEKCQLRNNIQLHHVIFSPRSVHMQISSVSYTVYS